MCKRSTAFATVFGTLLLVAFPVSAFIAPPPGGHGRPPVAPPGWAYRWMPPSYQTVTDRAWVAGSRQLIADMIETSPGNWERVWREVVTPGHWEVTTRQVLISPGYWQFARLEPPMPLPRPIVVVGDNPGTVPVEGYASGSGEDLSKFSPLTEWPK